MFLILVILLGCTPLEVGESRPAKLRKAIFPETERVKFAIIIPCTEFRLLAPDEWQERGGVIVSEDIVKLEGNVEYRISETTICVDCGQACKERCFEEGFSDYLQYCRMPTSQEYECGCY